MLNSLGWVHLECESHERGIELSVQGVKRARETLKRHAVGVEMATFATVNWGDGLLRSGDLAGARDVYDEAFSVVRNPKTHVWMKWRYTTHLLASLAEFWLARGDPVRASQFAGECMEIALRNESRKYVAICRRALGSIALAGKQFDEAESYLRASVQLATEISNPGQQWRSLAALGDLHAAAGRGEAAREAYGAARDVVDGLVADLREPELRAGLERSARVAQIVELAGPKAPH